MRLVRSLMLILALVAGGLAGSPAAAAPQTSPRPNIVFILTDDLDIEYPAASWIDHVPRLRALLADPRPWVGAARMFIVAFSFKSVTRTFGSPVPKRVQWAPDPWRRTPSSLPTYKTRGVTIGAIAADIDPVVCPPSVVRNACPSPTLPPAVLSRGARHPPLTTCPEDTPAVRDPTHPHWGNPDAMNGGRQCV